MKRKGKIRYAIVVKLMIGYRLHFTDSHLQAIVYAVALLEKERDCPPHIREAAATIRRNVEVEARLIDDLLDLARVRSSKLTLRKEPVDAHEILRDAIAICLADSGQRRDRLVDQIQAQNTRIEADPARLRQIFWNLLSNAVKFTPGEGKIIVRTENSDGCGAWK